MLLKDIKKSYDLNPNYFLIPVYRTSNHEEYNDFEDTTLNEIIKIAA